MPRKRSFHHGDLRRALQEAAVKIVNADGLQALTLRAVAERAGVSHPALYRHFRSKDALLAAIAEEGFRRLGATLAAAVKAEKQPLDQFQAIGISYVHFALESRVHFRLMYGPELANRADHPSLQSASRQAFALLLDVVRACQAAGTVRSGDAVELALTAWSLTHGLALLILDRQVDDAGFTGARSERLIRNATSTLRDGLAHGAAKQR